MASDILSSLKPAAGSRKERKRIGRGQGSGRGGTSTRGHNGALSRSGTTYYAGFEGGQMPLVRRVPKRGFNNPFRVEYQVVNVEALEKVAARISNGIVTPEVMKKFGIVKKATVPVKVLGDGELKAKLDVSAHAFSKSAQEKIEKAGGKIQMMTKAASD
jgi:large subunit ribosomal protein L15